MMSADSGARPGVLRAGAARSQVRLLVAGLLGIAGVVATFVPALDHSVGAWVRLALLAPVVGWCALPVHRAAVRDIARGRLSSGALGSLGVLAAYGWSIHAVATDRSSQHLVPVAIASILLVLAHRAVELTGREVADDPAPAWLPPLVVVAAASALVGWWSVDGTRAGTSAGLSVLLAAGPAALLLAEPVALLVGRRRASALGVLAAGVAAIQATRRIDTIVLDKDGTVTTGELRVMAVDPVDPEHLRNLRWFAGALSHSSDHPIARAISKLAPRGRVSDVVTRPDIGISGSVDQHPVRIGAPSWIGVEVSAGLGTRIGVEVDERALGWITVGDTVRRDARAGVDRLRALGLEPILVSDRPEADTADLAAQTGIGVHHAQMSGGGCAAVVRHLQAQGRVVAMVGRCGAHAPALRAADLAISTAGQSVGDGIALAEVDVRGVGDVIGVMRSIVATMVANRRLAGIGMLVALPFAAAGWIEPMYAPLPPLVGMMAVAVNASRIPSKQPATDNRPN